MSDRCKFYRLVGDWAMQGSWWRSPRKWWRTCKMTLIMATLTWAVRAADAPQPQSKRLFDLGDNIALVWSGATFLTIMGIVFQAGQLANRIKTLELRMSAAEKTNGEIAEQAEKLAGLLATVAAMESNIEQINQGIHDIRSYLMTLSRGQH